MDLPPAQKSHRSRRNESRAATCSREIGPPNSRISPKSRDLSLTNTDRKKGEKGRKGYFESAETAPARDINFSNLRAHKFHSTFQLEKNHSA